MKRSVFITIITLFLIATPFICHAANPGILAFTSTPGPDGATSYSLSIKILIAMTALTLLPALLMMTTSFTRVLIVLAILRQAMGMPNIPTNQILIGLTLLITIFIMSPVFARVNTNAIQPYLNKQITEQQALIKAEEPFRQFMLKQTRESDIGMFAKMAGKKQLRTPDDIPMSVLMTSFVTSELKTAFQMGFLIYIPFLIIDLVVASVLMSMGMMMLSPLVISLPFKIMLFVLANGWVLLIGTLASSFSI